MGLFLSIATDPGVNTWDREKDLLMDASCGFCFDPKANDLLWIVCGEFANRHGQQRRDGVTEHSFAMAATQ